MLLQLASLTLLSSRRKLQAGGMCSADRALGGKGGPARGREWMVGVEEGDLVCVWGGLSW